MNLFDRFFIWLNRREVGTDAARNRYFIEREPRGGRARPRRWVLYAGAAAETSLPAGLVAWLKYGPSEAVAGVTGAAER